MVWSSCLTLQIFVLSHLSHVQLFAARWTVARQAPLSMGFSSKNTAVGHHFLLQVFTDGENEAQG